MYHQTEQCRW